MTSLTTSSPPLCKSLWLRAAAAGPLEAGGRNGRGWGGGGREKGSGVGVGRT